MIGAFSDRSPWLRELLVEGHVGVAVDRRQHARVAAGREAFDLADDRLVVLMVERRVLLGDAVGRHALGPQERAQDLVGGPREHVVGPEQVELLEAAALLRHEVFGARNQLLVGCRAGVEDVLRALLAFVLHRVEQEAVVVLEHGQHGLAADRRPAAEDDRHLVLKQKLLGLLREQIPVRGRVDDDGRDLLAHDAALGVDLFHRHEHDVSERDFADGHRARERVEDADLDRLLRPQNVGESETGAQPGPCRERALEEAAT